MLKKCGILLYLTIYYVYRTAGWSDINLKIGEGDREKATINWEINILYKRIYYSVIIDNVIKNNFLNTKVDNYWLSNKILSRIVY